MSIGPEPLIHQQDDLGIGKPAPDNNKLPPRQPLSIPIIDA